MVNDQPLSVGFWDTAGHEDYDRLRPLSYPMTDVFGLMFALGGEGAGASLENIQSKWILEAKHRAYLLRSLRCLTRVRDISCPR